MGIIKQQGIEFFKKADIIINGSRPWDIQVHNDNFYSRLYFGGTIALGESYVDGWWDCKAIDQFISKALRSDLDVKLRVTFIDRLRFLKAKLTNEQSKSGSSRDVRFHYDWGIDLFTNMLDKRMNYSCGYWKHAKTLDEAQKAKLYLVCKKLKLKPGMRILDIGCGFGAFAKFAAEKYKVKIVGLTLSKDQAQVAREMCKNLDVEIKLQDYRDHIGQYDRVVSIEMIEHVGYKNYGTYMQVVTRCLKPDGLFLMQTAGISTSIIKNDPWLTKYIFPGTMPPSAKQIINASEGIFLIEDWHTFGEDMHKTMIALAENFKRNWPKLKHKYDERFYRMWIFYLLCLAGSYKARRNQVWQIVFTKIGSDMKYKREC